MFQWQLDGAAGRHESTKHLAIVEGQQTCDEKYLSMLHINLRGYVSHIAEVTALLRGMVNKQFLVTLNETFLTKAIENVQLEGYQVLVRRDRESQWGGGVLVFVLDEYAPRVMLVGKLGNGGTHMGYGSLRSRAVSDMLLVQAAKPRQCREHQKLRCRIPQAQRWSSRSIRAGRSERALHTMAYTLSQRKCRGTSIV